MSVLYDETIPKLIELKRSLELAKDLKSVMLYRWIISIRVLKNGLILMKTIRDIIRWSIE